MDYFQGVVTEYLRADRAVFVNTECCIQLNPGANPDTSGPHWYCDAVAVDHRQHKIFLCEITYAKSLSALQSRLTGWAANWPGVLAALARDSALPSDWPVRPWVFTPENLLKPLENKIRKLSNVGTAEGQMPLPKVTSLESVMPWVYCSWNRASEVETCDAQPIVPADAAR